MASRRIAGITIEIDGNTTKLNDALKGVDKQLSSTQSQLKDVEKLLKLDPRNTELLSQKQGLLKDAIKGSRDRLVELEKAQAELSQKDSTPEVAKQQAALQREIIATKQQLKGFEDELGKIPNAASRAFTAVGEELKQVGDKMTKVGEDMTKKVTAPIVGIGAASVAAFTEVDDAMDTVILKTGATGAAAKDMQKIVENVATTIPTDFNTAANAVGQINTKFGATGQELENLTSLFVKFASVNEKDVSASVDSIQKAMNAYGLSMKDANHFMDMLTKTSQSTGADVDKLTNGIIQNAAAFQELGLSTDQAVTLMGQMERSGANSETVMNGLRKALQKSTKAGVPLNKVLMDLQDSIRNNKDQTQALTDTYDLFGKSGDQIYNAIKNGTLDFTNFGDAVQVVGDVVNDTFDATVDGVDNWKMAMNEVKLLGADIGGILSEFAGPILRKVRDALAEAVQWWRGLSDQQQETIIKTAGVIAAIGPAITVVGKLTSTIGLLSQGLGLLAAHPVAAAIIGITAAATAGVVALKEHTDAVKAEYEASYGLTEEVKAANKAIEDQAQRYSELKDRREESFSGISAEYDYLKELAEEYDTYLDDNGQIIEKYKDRANFIENELSKALGIEREDLQKIVQENGNIADSIDKVIEKRKAEALLNALQDDYVNAIQEREKAIDNLAEAEANRDKMIKVRNGMEQRHKELVDMITNSEGANEAQIHAWAEELGDLENAMADADLAIAEQEEYVNQARETYEGYQTTIKNYEGVSAAVLANDTQAIGRELSKFRQDFKTTETATSDSLKRQVQSYQREYENAKTAVANGSKSITKADLAEKEYWYKQAQLEYNKATKAAKNAASDQADGYASQLRAGRPKVERASDYVAGGAIDPLNGLKGKAEDAGYYLIKGLADGISRNKHLATYAANNAARAVDAQLRGDFLINSPSKLTQYFGQMLDEGLAIGINGGEAIKAAHDMSAEVARQFEAQREIVVNAAPNQTNMVDALSSALSRMKVEMDDREMGRFVENTVVRAVYA